MLIYNIITKKFNNNCTFTNYIFNNNYTLLKII